MNKENKYEKMYEMLMDYENKIHERNQKRIRIGLKCIWIIPLVFLTLLFLTGSSKIIFLILWIASLFGIAIYLIYIEYTDYKLQEKLHELDDEAQISSLLDGNFENIENMIKSTIEKINENLNLEEASVTLDDINQSETGESLQNDDYDDLEYDDYLLEDIDEDILEELDDEFGHPRKHGHGILGIKKHIEKRGDRK